MTTSHFFGEVTCWAGKGRGVASCDGAAVHLPSCTPESNVGGAVWTSIASALFVAAVLAAAAAAAALAAVAADREPWSGRFFGARLIASPGCRAASAPSVVSLASDLRPPPASGPDTARAHRKFNLIHQASGICSLRR